MITSISARYSLEYLAPYLTKNQTMKTIKNLAHFLLLLLFSVFSNAQEAMPEPLILTLEHSKSIQNASELVIDLKGEIMAETWDEDNNIWIEIKIKSNDWTCGVVECLLGNGRFRLDLEILEDGILYLSMPGLRNNVIVNGKPLAESISIRVLVPKNVLVKFKA